MGGWMLGLSCKSCNPDLLLWLAEIEILPTPLSLLLQIFAALPPATRIQSSFKSRLTRQNEDDQHAVTPRLGEERKKKQRAGLIVENDGDRR